MSTIVFNKMQMYALNRLMAGSNVFLTGDAGTGKTTVIQEFIKKAEDAGKNVLVTATTGIAAENIGHGALTVHRALEISIKADTYKKEIKDRPDLLRAADILIIDEISMCRFDLFNMVGKIIEFENESRLSDRLMAEEDAREDVQLVVIGDFCQLPPVITADDREKLLPEMYGLNYARGGKYERGYAFMSEYWQRMNFDYIELKEVCRQDNKQFQYVLTNIKNGTNIYKAIKYLTQNQAPNIMQDAPFLVGRNAKADQINNVWLAGLNPDTQKTFEAVICGDVEESDLKAVGFAPRELTLNIGAKIMITVNDMNRQFVNGTIGTVVDMIGGIEPYVKVRTTAEKTFLLHRYKKEIEKQVVEEKEEKITVDGKEKTITKKKLVRKKVGTFEQFPLKLAWAISIHKSQGQTFEKINIDPTCWEPGQFYVAVSRAKSVQGIRFVSPIKRGCVKAFSEADKKILLESFGKVIA